MGVMAIAGPVAKHVTTSLIQRVQGLGSFALDNNALQLFGKLTGDKGLDELKRRHDAR